MICNNNTTIATITTSNCSEQSTLISSLHCGQCELELMREEKKRAETQLRTLQRERQLQEENLRQEAEKLAKVR